MCCLCKAHQCFQPQGWNCSLARDSGLAAFETTRPAKDKQETTLSKKEPRDRHGLISSSLKDNIIQRATNTWKVRRKQKWLQKNKNKTKKPLWGDPGPLSARFWEGRNLANDLVIVWVSPELAILPLECVLRWGVLEARFLPWGEDGIYSAAL